MYFNSNQSIACWDILHEKQTCQPDGALEEVRTSSVMLWGPLSPLQDSVAIHLVVTEMDQQLEDF